jgi:Tfp pilus assembly protein PilX
MSQPERSPDLRRSERGVALLASVLLLLMLASIGMASLNVVEKDQQVAGYLNRKAIALQAADAAVAKALETLDQTGTPTVPAATLGDTAMYPYGQPSYRADTTVADPIQDVGVANLGGMGLQIGANNSAQFLVRFWNIRVQGEAPGATIARVEVLTGSVVGN